METKPKVDLTLISISGIYEIKRIQGAVVLKSVDKESQSWEVFRVGSRLTEVQAIGLNDFCDITVV